MATTTMSPLAWRDCQANRRSVSASRSALCQPDSQHDRQRNHHKNMRPVVFHKVSPSLHSGLERRPAANAFSAVF